MCGIAGFVELSGSAPDLARLKRMTRIIAHRGPDDDGALVWNNVALGHRRLSIVDPSPRGHQPMCDVEGAPSAWIVFNGEIYNHRQLRDRLNSPDPFRSTTDTEVLLRACRHLGSACFKELNGIFAFAVLDLRKRELILVRDQFGIKPLYYAQDSDRFYFASEIKSILAAGFAAEVDRIGAIDFVFTGWTADNRNLLRGVQRLPPGSALHLNVDTGATRVERYYRPEPNWQAAANIDDSDDAWQDAVASALRRAIRGQLMSDVPVGAFCSGGVDSSLVSAMAAAHKPDILAFNVACPDAPEHDEAEYAQRVAEHLGIRLHTLNLTRDEFRRAVVQVVHVTEYPLSFLNTVPLYLLSKLARDQGVKVLLSGEGADEAFGGYTSQYRSNALKRVVRSKGRLGQVFLGGGMGLASRAGSKIGMRSSGGRSAAMHDVLSGGLRNWRIHEDAMKTYKRLKDPLDRELAAELLTQLQSYLLPILHRTDRASMAASVEARVPFLDPDLVALALAVPPRMKVGVTGFRPVGKLVLKRIAEEWLPRSIVHRPKMGFTVPAAYYTGPWPREWVEEGFVVTTFGLEAEDLRAWLSAESGQTAGWMLTLEIWGQIFVRGRSPAEVADDYLRTP